MAGLKHIASGTKDLRRKKLDVGGISGGYRIMNKSSCAGRVKTESFKIDLGLIAEYVGSDIFAEQKLCCDAAIKDHCIIQSSTFPTGAHFILKKAESQTSSMFSLDPISS